MSEIRAMMERYKQVRERLRNPPNAVPDTGINLRPQKTESTAPPPKPAPPTRPVAHFANWVPLLKRTDLTFSSSLEFTAIEFGISFQDIRCSFRKQKFFIPRCIAIYLTNKITNQSLMSMARYLGVDHTTTLHARNTVQKLVENGDIICRRITLIEERLLANFDRTSVSTFCQPRLGRQKKQQNGNTGANEVKSLSRLDSGG
jgi:hypothetical protein